MLSQATFVVSLNICLFFYIAHIALPSLSKASKPFSLSLHDREASTKMRFQCRYKKADIMWIRGGEIPSKIVANIETISKSNPSLGKLST